MSNNRLEQYDRNRMSGFVMEHISSVYGISLGDAVGIYIANPELEEHINHDDYNVVMDASYPEKLLNELRM